MMRLARVTLGALVRVAFGWPPYGLSVALLWLAAGANAAAGWIEGEA